MGNPLKHYRRRKGLTQTQLSSMTGGIVPQSVISLIENSRYRPRYDEAVALSVTLGVSVDKLFPEYVMWKKEDPDKLDAMQTQYELDQYHRAT